MMLEFILFMGVVNGFTLGFILFTIKNGNEAATKVFGGVLILIALIILENTLVLLGWHKIIPHVLRTTDGLVLLMLPSFYLYAQLVTDKGRGLRKKDLLHLIPFILFSIALIPYYALNASAKLSYNDSDNIILFGYLKALSAIFYLPLSIRCILKFKKNVGQNSLPSNNLDNAIWFYRLLIVICIIALVSILSFSWQSLDHSLPLGSDSIASVLLTIVFYANGLILIKNPFILWGTEQIRFNESQIIDNQKIIERVKYKNSPLSRDQQLQYLQRLIHEMEHGKAYLNPELSPLILQNLTQVKAHYITEILNVVLKQNFYEFVNAYRIEEFKKLISNKENDYKTLLGLGMESGFNSKSSMNRIFKQFTGKTPSQYKLEVRSNQSIS